MFVIKGFVLFAQIVMIPKRVTSIFVITLYFDHQECTETLCLRAFP